MNCSITTQHYSAEHSYSPCEDTNGPLKNGVRRRASPATAMPALPGKRGRRSRRRTSHPVPPALPAPLAAPEHAELADAGVLCV